MNFRLNLLASLVAVVAPTLASAPAHAVNFLLDDPSRPCLEWNVDFRNANQLGRDLQTTQANGIELDLTLRQEGTRITGEGDFISNRFYGGDVRGRGEVTGTVTGNVIAFESNWGGVYWGQIDASGFIHGITHPKGSGNWVEWNSIGRVECMRRGDTRPAPTRPPLSSTQPVSVSDAEIYTAQNGAGTGPSRASSVFGTRPQPTATQRVAASSPPSVYCKVGYVWRVARPSDLVCVTPRSRDKVAAENQLAASRIGRERGAYGRNTCKVGFVWREAFPGDLVCVTPVRRTIVANENRLGPSRVQ